MVCDEPFAVIAHKSAKGRTDRDILRSNPYVRFNPKALVSRIVERELARRRIAITSHMEVDTLEGVFSLVANQLGVSIVPVPTGVSRFAPSVRLIPFGNPNVTRRLGLLQPVGNSRAHFADLLFEELVAAAHGAPPAMPGRRRRRTKPTPPVGKAELVP